MVDLDSMLKLAASEDGWKHVIHRCAWCKHVFDERGRYMAAALPDVAGVATDGTCPPCGVRALAHVLARKQRRTEAEAA